MTDVAITLGILHQAHGDLFQAADYAADSGLYMDAIDKAELLAAIGDVLDELARLDAEVRAGRVTSVPVHHMSYEAWQSEDWGDVDGTVYPEDHEPDYAASDVWDMPF